MQSSMLHFCEECGAANPDDATRCVACQRELATLEPVPPPAPVIVTPPARLEVTANETVVRSRSGRGSLLRGRYRLLKEIGQGGFGSVYLARDRRQRNRLVAI